MMQAETTAPAPGKQESSSVQATLRRVIELGRYGADVSDYTQQVWVWTRHRYMCCALELAQVTDEITLDECAEARDAIDAYITPEHATLRGRLERAGLVSNLDADEFAETVGRQLYWDWDKRPSLA